MLKRNRKEQTTLERLTWRDYQTRHKKAAAEREKLIHTIFRNSRRSIPKRPGWKEYQEGLKKAVDQEKLIKRFVKGATIISLSAVVLYVLSSGFEDSACRHRQETETTPPSAAGPSGIRHDYCRLLKKREVRDLLGSKNLVNLTDKSFVLAIDGRNFRVDTSIDISLQNFIEKNLDRSTSRHIGIVAMDPSTGKILSMVGLDKTNQSPNPCIDTRFPAASIFKIVTAAAAIEKCGFNSGTTFSYNGKKYTLYKSQLDDRRNKYTTRITFQDSFAQSVNPVFGKIGALYLGKNALEKYAEAFGFNRNIDFEIPLAPSIVSLSDKPYQWAEIACGFNQMTRISPLHGALMASVVLNEGNLIEPTIVDQIVDDQGTAIYQSRPTTLNQAITPEASKAVNKLMEATIRSGTCRKLFRGYRKDRILSKLNIGGKTGSIDDTSHEARFDWFIGFAQEKRGDGKIVLSVIVAHEKYIGKRAGYYAKIAMKEYFRDYFAKNRDQVDIARNSS
jgi:peptidoglycan glycosyltransferase